MQNLYIAVFFSIILSFSFYYFLIKKELLLDQVNSSNHKKLTFKKFSTKVPLCGGIIIFISCLLFLDNELFVIKILSALILFTGILSDANKLNSPKLRFLFQFFIVLFLVLFNDHLIINNLKIDFINEILSIKSISIIFTVFCILILINGSNFLDGINTLVIGYYILVLGFLALGATQFNLYLNPNVFYLIGFFSVIFIFNFFNKIYLGDAGSYLVPFLSAFFILDFFSNNDLVSPYYICLLLWYPAFENLFSIVRRLSFKKKIDQADQGHLHQMIYLFLKNKNIFNERYINTFAGILINSFNFLIFILFYKYFFFTKVLSFAIFFNISIYLFLYFFIKKKLHHSK